MLYFHAHSDTEFPDQPVHIMLYYTGGFGEGARAIPWGLGPVVTVGAPCSNEKSHSQTDVIKKNRYGMVIRDDGTVAPMIHQFDRCIKNLVPVVRKYSRKLHKMNGLPT